MGPLSKEQTATRFPGNLSRRNICLRCEATVVACCMPILHLCPQEEPSSWRASSVSMPLSAYPVPQTMACFCIAYSLERLLICDVSLAVEFKASG